MLVMWCLKYGRQPCIDVTSLWKLGYTYHVQYFFYPFLRVTEEKNTLTKNNNEKNRKESLKKMKEKRNVTHFITHSNMTCQ